MLSISATLVPMNLTYTEDFLVPRLIMRSDDRDSMLRQMGYSSYAVYLRSNEWLEIRRLVFQSQGKACLCCRSAANIVHHRRYCRRVMLGLDLSALMPLCEECHNVAHKGGCSLEVANRRIDFLRVEFKRLLESTRMEKLSLGEAGAMAIYEHHRRLRNPLFLKARSRKRRRR